MDLRTLTSPAVAPPGMRRRSSGGRGSDVPFVRWLRPLLPRPGLPWGRRGKGAELGPPGRASPPHPGPFPSFPALLSLRVVRLSLHLSLPLSQARPLSAFLFLHLPLSPCQHLLLVWCLSVCPNLSLRPRPLSPHLCLPDSCLSSHSLCPRFQPPPHQPRDPQEERLATPTVGSGPAPLQPQRSSSSPRARSHRPPRQVLWGPRRSLVRLATRPGAGVAARPQSVGETEACQRRGRSHSHRPSSRPPGPACLRGLRRGL